MPDNGRSLLVFDGVVSNLRAVGLIDYHTVVIVLGQHMSSLLWPYSVPLLNVGLHSPLLRRHCGRSHATDASQTSRAATKSASRDGDTIISSGKTDTDISLTLLLGNRVF